MYSYYPGLQYLSEVQACAAHLMTGGLLIYPTETFYALGCMADNAQAIAKIFRFKKRPSGKPLPLLAANREMANAVCHLENCPPRLLDLFWPGPLTLILPAKEPVMAISVAGKCAIRVTSNNFARQLAELCAFPLTCSSANFSGQTPCTSLADMPEEFMAMAAQFNIAVAPTDENNKGTTMPSTIAEPIKTGQDEWRLRICRPGQIDKSTLIFHNFNIF